MSGGTMSLDQAALDQIAAIVDREIQKALGEPVDAVLEEGPDIRAMVREEVAAALTPISETVSRMWQDVGDKLQVAGAAATVPVDNAAIAREVLLGPPQGDHFGLPANARFGTMFQEVIAVMFLNQAFWQETIKAINDGAAGLRAGGYKPPK